MSQQQIILVGASNVAIGFGTIWRLLRAGFRDRIDIRAAIGHGRSYGRWSRFAGRALPGIIDCGLWRSLEEPANSKRYALLTDIGNDLLYGTPPEQIAGWVETCLVRLRSVETSCVVTRLPIERIERLSAARYHATRLVFFPGHRPVAWPEMLDRARRLDKMVAEIAARQEAALISPRGEWYGLDPIHILRGHRTAAWGEMLSAWPGFEKSANCQPVERLRLLGRFPEHYRLLGREGRCPQPVVERRDCSLRLY